MIEDAIKKLSEETVKNTFYISIVSCFWGLSLFITKPEIFKESLFILFFILFCTSFVWCFVSSIFGILLEVFAVKLGSFKNEIILHIRVELYLLVAVFIKCIFISFAYYYSFSFTEYLRFIIKWSVISIVGLFLIILIGILCKKEQTV
jgi:hypothetical protein